MSASDATFVVFEGGDGSGKSTQSRRVAQARGALWTRQPGGTTIGSTIREIFINETELDLRSEALLMAADRAQHVGELIRPTLAAGRDVVCDRYLASSVAYQGAGRQLGVDRVLALSEFAVDGCRPDLTVFLDVPVQVGLDRIDGDPDRFEAQNVDFHERVRRCYLDMAQAGRDAWIVIDASPAPDQVAAAIDAALAERLGWEL